jgi:pimeloyl-ACP methyl ester carboxylesterase
MTLFAHSPAISIHYLDVNPGAAECVLLLHGLGATSDSWQLQIPALAETGFRVVAPDAPGFGQSTRPGRLASMSNFSDPILSLLAQLNIHSAHIAGISMGGVMALQITLDRPGLVKTLTLVNTFARLQISSVRLWPYYLWRFILVHTLGLPAQAKAVARRIFPRPEQEPLRQALIQQILQADPRGYRAAMRALARFDVQNRLHEITAPVLVITGENDTTVSPESQHRLAAGIAQARQITIPGAGHALTVEHPETFNRILVEFLRAPSQNPGAS